MTGEVAHQALSLEQSHNFRLRQRVEMQVEANHGGRGVRLDVKLLRLHGEDGEEITMRMVSFGRARTAITRRAEVCPRLQRARRQFTACTARPELEFAHVRRNINDQPVPEARSGRCIGVVAGYSEALRA